MKQVKEIWLGVTAVFDKKTAIGCAKYLKSFFMTEA